MTKEEINNAIFSLQTDEDIIDFANKRIAELENSSVETTVGQNYTTTFKEYISEKTHYKAGEKLQDAECPDLVYDDIMNSLCFLQYSLKYIIIYLMMILD